MACSLGNFVCIITSRQQPPPRPVDMAWPFFLITSTTTATIATTPIFAHTVVYIYFTFPFATNSTAFCISEKRRGEERQVEPLCWWWWCCFTIYHIRLFPYNIYFSTAYFPMFVYVTFFPFTKSLSLTTTTTKRTWLFALLCSWCVENRKEEGLKAAVVVAKGDDDDDTIAVQANKPI